MPEPERSFNVKLSADTDSSFRLDIQNPEKKKLELSLVHTVFGVMKDTVIADLHYAGRFNFSLADDGKYKLIVRSGKERYTRELELNTTTVINRNLRIR